MLIAKQDYELEIEGHPPTPPFRAEPPLAPSTPDRPATDRPATDRPIPAGAPPAAASGPKTAPAADADQVTRLLGQLADLRERGAITPEEYEAKKAELLGRL
jgi:hypothetical protein